MDPNHVYDIIIIGGGPAGFTAALYAARAGLDAIVLEKLSAGGQMALTREIDNYPGAEIGIDGITLAEKMRESAERAGCRTEYTEVLSAALERSPKAVETPEGTVYGRTVIFCTGAVPRELGVPGEQNLVGRGVAYCAACDGMFYKGKVVAVIGGGNSAAEEAMLLSRIAGKVFLIHRRDTLRAVKSYRDSLQNAGNVEFRWNTVVTGFTQNERLTGLKLKDVSTGTESVLECDGAFISVGRKPASDLAQSQLTLDAGGYIVAGETTCTSLPGVFAAGDVRTKAVRQIVTAAADGAAAVHSAQEYLANAPEAQPLTHEKAGHPFRNVL